MERSKEGKKGESRTSAKIEDYKQGDDKCCGYNVGTNSSRSVFIFVAGYVIYYIICSFPIIIPLYDQTNLTEQHGKV